MASHDDVDLDPFQRAVVKIVAHKCLRHKLCCASEARAVIGNHQVVIDGLGNMEGVHFVALVFRHFVDDVGRFRRVVSADVEEEADVMFLEICENLTTFFVRRFLANRTKSR